MVKVGAMYALGKGTATNNAEARRWLQIAAGRGNESAKKILAML